MTQGSTNQIVVSDLNIMKRAAQKTNNITFQTLNKNCLASFVLGILIVQISFAQSVNSNQPRQLYRAVHWGLDDGLGKERWHNAIIKDINGFLWFGSSHGELSRFDGNRFQQYYPDKNKTGTIRSNRCIAFCEDSAHHIWIGTAKGLSRYDIQADTFTNFVTILDSGIDKSQVTPFWVNHDQLFCLESGSWISEYNTTTFEHKRLLKIAQEHQANLTIPASSYIIFDSSTNSIWMLPQKGIGLIQFILATGEVIDHRFNGFKPYQNSNKHHTSEAMCYDKIRSCIWINSPYGLLQFMLGTLEFHTVSAFDPLVKIKEYDRWVGIDIDPQGKIWLATTPKGILIYDPSTQTIDIPIADTARETDLASGNLKIYCDRDGIIWTSYWSINGIFQLIPYSPSVQRYYANKNQRNALSSDDIAKMIPADHGTLWMGTREGINIFNPGAGTFEVLREKDLPPIKGTDIDLMSIDTIQQKTWINAGPHDRVYEMNMKTRECRNILFKDTANRIINSINVINSLAFPFKKGILFFDAGYGWFQIDKDSLVAHQVIPMAGAYVTRAVLGEDSKLFLRTPLIPTNQNYKHINDKWVKIPHLLDSLEWWSMTYDVQDQSYWVGITNSILHYDKNFKLVHRYTDENGNIGDPLTLLLDSYGNIWFNNDHKIIARLNIKTGIISALSEADGYKKQPFDVFTAEGKTANGEMYFIGNFLAPGKVGLDRINPDKFALSPPSSVYVKSLNINQKPYSASLMDNNPGKLSLRYFENEISIETGIINYYSKGENHLRYKLEQKDKSENWQFAPYYFTIRYQGLQPGNYRLIMQASNAANEFNGPEKILTFTIDLPFWSTWWFRIIVTLFGLSSVLGFVKYRAKNLEERNIMLENKITERTNELNNSLIELKTTQDQLIQSEKMASLGELTSGIAHEIKNPLNFINNFSEINLELLTEIEEDQNTSSNTLSPASLVVDTETIKNLKKNSEKINHHGKRVDDIVKGMLQHSRLGNAVKESININALCEESLKLAFHGFRAKEKTFNATFVHQFEPDLPNISVIPQDIGRVLLNLINNAFYAVAMRSNQISQMTEGLISEASYVPTVMVSTKKMDNKIIITISDNGIGIPQSIISKIFQPFFTTKPTGEGTGLGLSMAYDIITKSHGGLITVKSYYHEPGVPIAIGMKIKSLPPDLAWRQTGSYRDGQAGKEGIGTDFEIILPINS